VREECSDAGRRRRLPGRCAARPADLGNISFGKRVGEGTSLAVERLSQIAAHDRLQITLEEVARAEVKLVEGTYGRCDRCDEAIAEARLEAMPWATRCVRCAGAGPR
jgi:DnaK suppressor protein